VSTSIDTAPAEALVERPDTVETGRDVIVRSTADDPDGDRLLLEWDPDDSFGGFTRVSSALTGRARPHQTVERAGPGQVVVAHAGGSCGRRDGAAHSRGAAHDSA